MFRYRSHPVCKVCTARLSIRGGFFDAVSPAHSSAAQGGDVREQVLWEIATGERPARGQMREVRCV